MVAMMSEHACVGGFSPTVINARWMRPSSLQEGRETAISSTPVLASDDAMAVHPDDLLDQVLHDDCKCGCYNS